MWLACNQSCHCLSTGGGFTWEQLLSEFRREVRSEIAPTKKLLNLVIAELLDPWEKIHSETESTIEAAEQKNLEPVSSFYGIQKKACMVLGRVTHCKIKCAHIWPRWTRGNGLEAFDLNNADLNNPRNFLRLHRAIERAFDRKRLVIAPETLGSGGELTLKIVILDPSLHSESLEYNNATEPFSTINNKLFSHVFVPNKMPYTRLLSNHAVQAMDKAKMLGWIPEDDAEMAATRTRAVEMARRSLGTGSLSFKTLYD